MTGLPEFGYGIGALLLGVVDYGYWILFGFIIASILIGWLPGYPSSAFFQALFDAVQAVTQPILGPIRARLPVLRIGALGIDLSPLVAIIGLAIAHSLLEIIIGEFIVPVTDPSGPGQEPSSGGGLV